MYKSEKINELRICTHHVNIFANHYIKTYKHLVGWPLFCHVSPDTAGTFISNLGVRRNESKFNIHLTLELEHVPIIKPYMMHTRMERSSFLMERLMSGRSQIISCKSIKSVSCFISWRTKKQQQKAPYLHRSSYQSLDP